MNITNSIAEAIHILKHKHAHHGTLTDCNLNFNFQDFCKILTNPLLRANQVRLTKKGVLVPKSEFTKSTYLGREIISDAIDDQKILKALAAGGTIIIDSLESINKDVNNTCAIMSKIFEIKSTATAYITSPAASGLMPHSDEEEIFIVQTSGTKYWKYAERQDCIARSAPLPRDALDMVNGILLKKGDYLCLPAGSPHAAETKEYASIHITFSIEKQRYSSLLIRAIEALLADAYPPLLEHIESKNLDKKILMPCLMKIIDTAHLLTTQASHQDNSANDLKEIFHSLNHLCKPGQTIKISLAKEINLFPSDDKSIITSEHLPGKLIIPNKMAEIFKKLLTQKEIIITLGNDINNTKGLFILSAYSILTIQGS